MACSSTSAITTLNDRDAPFSNSVLPSEGVARTSDGRLTDDGLNTVYQNMVVSGKLLSLDKYKQSLDKITNGTRQITKQILEQVGKTEKQTMNGIQAEFCHYYVRYKFCLEDLFDTLVQTSSGGTLTTVQQNEIQSKLDIALKFNNNLNDLIQITNYIAKARANEMGQQNTEINNINTNINTTFGALASQNAILKKQTSIADLRKRMVEYSYEKNKSTTNLLGLYGFFNLVSIGLLFYIAAK